MIQQLFRLRGNYTRAIFCALNVALLITSLNQVSYATENSIVITSEESDEFESNQSAVIRALTKATNDIQDIDRQIETIAWLQEMSRNIQKRVPNPTYRFHILRTVLDESLAAGVDPQLALAVIEVESNFNASVTSSVGAQGLMQVMPFWKNEIGNEWDDLYDMETNVRYGVAILKHYIDRYSPSVTRALAAYNGSLGRLKYPNKVYARLEKHWEFESHFSLKKPEIVAIESKPE